jgi:transcriptional regulator with PAS, ATPase and Fis domain
MIMALLMALVMSSCEKKPETLEEFVNSNEDSMKDIQKTADESGLKVDIKGNEVTYSYDISDYDGMTEEIAKGDQMKKALEDALNDASDTFTGLCGDLEEESGIEGVTIKVNYTYKDENLITKVYDKSGIVEK